jgi:hypothetical protein
MLIASSTTASRFALGQWVGVDAQQMRAWEPSRLMKRKIGHDRLVSLTRRLPERRRTPRGYVPRHDMPWSTDRYPVSMRRLDPLVRLKAIEIANALLAEGMEEGLAIRIAIAKAKVWAEHHRA